MTPQAIQQAASGLAERILTDRQGISYATVILPGPDGSAACTRTKGQLIDLIYTGLAQYCPPDETESELHKIAAATKSAFIKLSIGVSSDKEFQLLHAAINLMIAFKDLDASARNRVLTYLYSRYFTP